MKATILTLLLAATSVVTACSKQQNKQENMQAENTEQKTVLVAYFSATGTTKAVAETLAKAADADLFEIVPEKPYTDADLDWTNKQSRSTLEMQDKQSRPAIADTVEHISQYKTIFVGFPVWWYTAPTIINTFLEQYNLEGVTLIPFATSGGSDIKNVHQELASSAPGAVWKQGRLLNGRPTVEELKEWVLNLR